MKRSRKRITYRPSKAAAVLGGVVGVLFVLIGIFVAIPTSGLFGVIWTLMALGITIANIGQAMGKSNFMPEIQVEDDENDTGTVPSDVAQSPQARLEQLRKLYDQRLITAEEYDAKRQEILKEL